MRKNAFLLSLLLSTPLVAQETVSNPSLQTADSAQWQQLTLQDVDVTAAKRVFANQSAEKTQTELQQLNIGQNLPYLIASTPGWVATSDDGLGIGYTYLHLRGTDHTRINMTVNGIPLNDPESQTVFWVNLTDMGASVDRLMVQRGVGTSKNGSSAFGASVNMQTLYDVHQLDEQPVRASLQFTGGMYNTFRESASLYARIGQWHLGGRFSKVNSDGYIERAASDLLSYQGEAGWQSRQREDGQLTQ
ncbi:MAG: TonB-dependent receptor plug domain-containing protein, partial [Paludibacteraceae bacterium]|nr:TonB-dependent receptor plug domain-containing protein [Paludibacteraceae bacterium]